MKKFNAKKIDGVSWTTSSNAYDVASYVISCSLVDCKEVDVGCLESSHSLFRYL